MSSALNKAIYKRLTGGEDFTAYPAAAAAQTALAALLGVDPFTHKPAVYANRPQAGSQMPCIIFRASAGNPDNRFQTSGMRVGDVITDFEFWDGPDSVAKNGLRGDGTRPDGARVHPIALQVELLLDTRCTPAIAPPMVLTAGRSYDFELFVELSENYMKIELGEAWQGVLRYWCKEARF